MHKRSQLYTQRAFSTLDQCDPIDLFCKFRVFVESFWGVMNSREYDCIFDSLQVSDGKQFLRASCKDTKRGFPERCEELPYPFSKTTCRIECEKNNLKLENAFCKQGDLMCICDR